MCYDWCVDLTEIIGVLGFILAAISLGWQIRSQHTRLRIEIDEEKSEFFTTNILRRVRNGESRSPVEACTVIFLVLSVANVSRRSNTVVTIDVPAPAAHHPLSVEGKVVLKNCRGIWDLSEWKLPRSLPPGDRHEAYSWHVLANGVWDTSTPMAVKVRVVDAYGKAQFVNRMRHLVTAAARQARSLAPGARPTRWNQLR